MKTLIENSELRKSMGANLKEYVYNNCDVSCSFQQLVETFDTLYFNKKRRFNHPTPYDLADCHDGIPEIKLSYNEKDFCPCGSGQLYLKCKNNCYPAWGHIKD